VDKTGDWLVRHPGVVAGVFAGLGAMVLYDTFRAGMAYAQLWASASEAARVASEALGG
jgi:hypothetical protein